MQYSVYILFFMTYRIAAATTSSSWTRSVALCIDKYYKYKYILYYIDMYN